MSQGGIGGVRREGGKGKVPKVKGGTFFRPIRHLGWPLHHLKVAQDR